MGMDQIHAAAKRLYDGASRLTSNASQAVGGPSNLTDATQGTVAGLSHPLETGKAVLKSFQNIPAEHGRLLLKARDAWKAGDKEAAAQHFFNSLIPLVGPTSDRAGEQLKKGDYVAGAGTTLGAILPLLFGGESGAAVAEKAESGLSEAGEVAAPKANAESAPKPAAKVETVGSAAAAKADTDFFQQAKTELGSNASISKIAQRAQELKVASKQVSINASGESSASLEAINRVSSERSRGIKRFRVDTRSGKEMPIVGADAVDATAGPYDVILQRGPEGEVILDTGSKARPLGRKSSASQTAGSLLAGTGGALAKRTSKTSTDKTKSQPEGMIEAGNLNLNGRPIIKNSDGSVSSEYSTSFGDDKGREILVPTVVKGKFLTPDGKKPKPGSPEEKQMFKRAQQHYEQTGEHLGIFDTPEHADAYAERVHSRKLSSSGSVYVLPNEADDLKTILSKYSNASDIYSQIIAFRKQAKNMDPDERASVEKAIAEFSNALNRANPVRKTNKTN